MHKLTKINSKLGHIDNYTSQDKTLLYAIPHGYIGPSLIKQDLTFLLEFDKNCSTDWQYLVDTSKVKAINPINPFLLRRLKQCSKMSEYVVYAPSPITRLMLKLSGWISRPDRVLEYYDMLQLELKN